MLVGTQGAPSKRFVGLVLGACLFGLALPHIVLLAFGHYVNVDEAYAIAIGERMNEGYRLYEGAVSQRGPLMYHWYALIARFGGWDAIAPIRLWAFAVAAAHVGGTWWMGERLLARGAGAVSAIVVTYALVFGFDPWDGLALNGEVMLLPLVLFGAAAGAVMMRPASHENRLLLFAAGLSFGAAVAIKPSAILHPLPLAIWIASAALRGKRRRAPVELALLFAGVILVPLAFVLVAAHDGTLRAMFRYCVEYNLTAHRSAAPDPIGSGMLWAHFKERTGFFVLLVAAIGAHAGWVRRRARSVWRTRRFAALFRGFGASHYFFLHAIVAIAMAAALPQQFGHYYIPALPFLALSIALPIARSLRDKKYGRVARRLVVVGCGFTVLACSLFSVWLATKDGRPNFDPQPEKVAAYIQATTPAKERIFVWGFSPWIHGYSHRRPAGRFLFETYVTGWVPIFWEGKDSEPGRVVPGAMAALIGDLETEKPDVIVDAGSIFIARPLHAYAPMSRFVLDNYCFEVRIGACDVYRRRQGGICAMPYFPCPHPPLDHFARPLFFVSMPHIVNRANARVMPGLDTDAPRTFPPGELTECPAWN